MTEARAMSVFEEMERLARELFEESVRESELARKVANWRWLIEQHESEHTTQ